MSTDLAAFKDNQRRLWAAGDYSVTARRFEDVARGLVAACGLGPGMRALDVGAGTGNVALAIAASGASPEACDLPPQLVEAGRGRCDALLSVFGLILAPRPEVAIAEAFRVTRSGGCVGFTSWTPGSAPARFGAVAAKYFPQPQDPPPPPHEWGEEEICRARLAPWAVDVTFERGNVRWSWPSAAAAREEAEESNNFVAAARAELSQERYMAFLDDADDVMRAMNIATDGGLTYDAEYARVVARKAG